MKRQLWLGISLGALAAYEAERPNAHHKVLLFDFHSLPEGIPYSHLAMSGVSWPLQEAFALVKWSSVVDLSQMTLPLCGHP